MRRPNPILYPVHALALAGLVTAALAAASILVAPDAFAMSDARNVARQAPELALPQQDDPWFTSAAARLAQVRSYRGEATAKNVILFIGDGMSNATVAAARIYEGQQLGRQGTTNYLSFETFPNVALSRTYTTDYQTPDSAGTASALVTGVKTKSGVISIDDGVIAGKCGTGQAATTILELAEMAGLATGIVTTTRVTHATPAVNFAHAASRSWESDANMRAVEGGCKDIASQLIDFDIGDGPEVVLGGGRTYFLPTTTLDPEMPKLKGKRLDGRDLTAEWIAKGARSHYVWDRAGFDAINFKTTGRILGLFQPSHMQYELDRSEDKGGEPSLAEMTKAALERLSSDKDGFYLMVEGGRIDHAHHANNAARALTDAIAFSDAIRTALEIVDLSETLIIVTADHAHTLTIAGYAPNGSPILGKVISPTSGKLRKGSDGKPYTILSYTNGPSGKRKGERDDLTDVDTTHKDFRQPAQVPMMSETHSGEDVAIYATGPGSDWINGVVEQNYLFHVMEGALRLRQRAAP